MDLQKNKTYVLQTLLDLINEGSELRDRINQEYRSKRSVGTFDPDKDIPEWDHHYAGWHVKCLQKIAELFDPSILVTNQFKNPQMDAQYREAAGPDVRLLLVADRICNSGKLMLDEGAALDVQGFQVVYFFSYPESVTVFDCTGNIV